VEQLPFGLALRQPETPRVRDLNQVLIDHPAPELTAAALAATVRRLGFEQADIGDGGTAERLLPGMEAAGWKTQRFVLLAAPRDLPAPAVDVEEVAGETIASLRREWLLEEAPFAKDRELFDQVIRADRILWAANATRGFCVRHDGKPAARAQLMAARDGMAMIEDVYTTPSRRGEGLGAAVVLAAAAAGRAAGCDLVYLPTGAEGLAQLFYRKLGFEPIGVITRFVVG
jgi:GNAT superfamily N-acetyltransferase